MRPHKGMGLSRDKVLGKLSLTTSIFFLSAEAGSSAELGLSGVRA